MRHLVSIQIQITRQFGGKCPAGGRILTGAEMHKNAAAAYFLGRFGRVGEGDVPARPLSAAHYRRPRTGQTDDSEVTITSPHTCPHKALEIDLACTHTHAHTRPIMKKHQSYLRQDINFAHLSRIRALTFVY